MDRHEIIDKIQFNHFYTLRHDLERTFILNNRNGRTTEIPVNEQWLSKIHPLFAMFFSLLSEPIKIEDAITETSYFLDITENEAEKLLFIFINSPEPFSLEFGNVNSYFPKNIVIDAKKASGYIVRYYPSEFIYKKINLEQERFNNAPLGIVYMINNICATDCVYCYADKHVKSSGLPLEKAIDIMKEARSLNVQTFSIVGGEFFMYKQWDELLENLVICGYKPDLISTKIPISEETILKYKKYEMPIQLSIDSLNDEKLSAILNVKQGYAEKIRNTIKLLNKHNIRFQISTVLTRYNDDISNLEEMYDFFKDCSKNINRWEIRVGFKSLYSKSHFDEIKIGNMETKKIEQWVNTVTRVSNIFILWSPSTESKYFKAKGGSRYFMGSRCSANYSHMIILPDGKATICEQLYWNSKFLIGDIKQNTISEIWNSPNALRLAFPQRNDFRKESACHNCKIFDECMNYPNRCITDVLKVYGEENYDYPDPRCHKAPIIR
jgi:radical SAM protein with 4Fe4S-binding SPASM domain